MSINALGHRRKIFAIYIIVYFKPRGEIHQGQKYAILECDWNFSNELYLSLPPFLFFVNKYHSIVFVWSDKLAPMKTIEQRTFLAT